MLQYKVPQNVGIEDKIVGPLTLRQLIIVSVGGGISYALFTLLGKVYDLNIIEIIVIAIPAVIAVAAALIKINDIPLPKFALLTLEYNIKPKQRHWDHRGIAAWIPLEAIEEKPAPEAAAEKDKRPGVNLSELSRILDSGGFSHVEVKSHPDLDQVKDDDLMAEAFFGHKPNDSTKMYWRSVKRDPAAAGMRLSMLAKLPPTPPGKPEAVAIKAPAAPTTIKPVAPAATPPPPIAPTKPMPTTSLPTATPPVPVARPPIQTPPPTPKAMPTPFPQAASPAMPMTDSGKKKRRRKKKKKSPVAHAETSINAMNKAQPVQFLPKPAVAPLAPKPEKPSLAADQAPQTSEGKKGEFEFKELERGEIEINLD